MRCFSEGGGFGARGAVEGADVRGRFRLLFLGDVPRGVRYATKIGMEVAWEDDGMEKGFSWLVSWGLGG